MVPPRIGDFEMPKATKRYFKATNGRFTVFRASPSRAYTSATIEERAGGYPHFSFSWSGNGNIRATEIDAAEYRKLLAAKTARLTALAAERVAANPDHADFYARAGYGTAPSDSWIDNVSLTPAPEA